MTAALRALPAFLPSNMTEEEFLNVIEPCLPRDVFERVKAMAGAVEQIESYESDDSRMVENLKDVIERARDKAITLRERYEALREISAPPVEAPEVKEADGLVLSSLEALDEILEAE